MNFKDFRLIKPTVYPATVTAAVIVCYNDTDVRGISKGLEHPGGKRAEFKDPWRDASPTHVAINSQMLAGIITSEIPWNLADTQQIFIRPFKGIVTHETAIRDAYKNLVMECNSEPTNLD
jgi:hypothetical protein